jgi:4-hydroxy-4-methyl-2-oxoglutarate aldolase
VTAPYDELAALGSATVYEAAGRAGLVDLDLVPLVPGARAAGPARTVRCGQGDNLMVHAVMSHARPGDVLVLTMPEPAPVALLGELLATQARARGVAAVLVDAAVRDREELAQIGLPVWARWVRVRGASKTSPGELDGPVEVGGATIAAGDAVVLDADGAVIVPQARTGEVLDAARERAERERVKRGRLEGGELSYDIDGLRAIVEGSPAAPDPRP